MTSSDLMSVGQTVWYVGSSMCGCAGVRPDASVGVSRSSGIAHDGTDGEQL